MRQHPVEKNLDRFARAYYWNKALRGALRALFYSLILVILFVLFEYQRYSDPSVRMVLFYVFLSFSLGSFLFFVFLPALKALKIIKGLSHTEISRVIGERTTTVKDTLLNAVELKKNEPQTGLQSYIIEKKFNSLSKHNFLEAISFQEVRLLLRWLLLPFFTIILSFFFAQKQIIHTAERIVLYNTYFEPIPDFHFVINDDSLFVEKGKDFFLSVSVWGKNIPKNLYVKYGNTLSGMSNSGESTHSFRFSSVQNNIDFQVKGETFFSKKRVLKVIERPYILDYFLELTFPPYTKISPQKNQKSIRYTVPEGAKVTWKYSTKKTDSLLLRRKNETVLFKSENDYHVITKKIHANENIDILGSNQHFFRTELQSFFFTVKKDNAPIIIAELVPQEYYDSAINFFITIFDDYGFSALTLFARNEKANIILEEKIPFSQTEKSQKILYALNKKEIQGKNIEFYVEVWDNDAVNGRKKTVSRLLQYENISEFEAEQQRIEEVDELISELSENSSDIEALRNQIEDLRNKQFSEESSKWESSKAFEKFLEEIEENIEETNKIKEDAVKRLSGNEEMNEKLDALFKEDFVSDKLTSLLEEIKKLLADDMLSDEEKEEKLQSLMQESEQMKHSNDRLVAMLKQLEFEKQFSEIQDGIKSIREQQDTLLKNQELPNHTQEKSIQQQEKIKEAFENIKKQLEQLEKSKRNMKAQFDVADVDLEKGEIDLNIQQAIQKLKEQGDGENAEENQKKVSELLKKMEEKLSSEKSSSSAEALKVDIFKIRRLLGNTLKVSYSQEENLTLLKSIEKTHPKFPEIILKQSEIKQRTKVIRDSLISLSKQSKNITSFMVEEISDIDHHLESAIKKLQDRIVNMGEYHLTHTMSSLNKISVLLEEAVNNTKMDLNNSKPRGQGSEAQRPSQEQSEEAKKQLQEMLKEQQKLNEQMQKMAEERGGGQGEKQRGEQQKGSERNGKKRSQLAEQQEKLKQLFSELEELFSGNSLDQQKIGKEIKAGMEENISDLLFENITRKTFERQKELIEKMLDFEKSLQENEKEKKRESNEAKQQFPALKNEKLEEYLKKLRKEVELLKSISPDYEEFYKKISREYLESILEKEL